MRAVGHPLVVFLGLLAVAYAPFLGQALHIDDQIYLMGADIVAADPLRPLSGQRGFLGWMVPYHRGVNSHPQGLPFYLAAGRGLTGATSETALHTLMLPFVGLLALGLLGLARELRLDGRVLMTLGLSAAPVMVMGHTLMTDLPFAALFCAALVALLRGLAGGAWPWTAALLVLGNAAWFVQYRGLLLVPLGLGLMAASRRFSLRTTAALAGLLVGLALWCLWNLWELDESHFFFSGGQIAFTRDRLVLSTATLLAHAGGTLLPLVLLVWHGLRERPRLLYGLGAASLGVSLLLTGLLPPSVPGSRILTAGFVALGTFIVGGTLGLGASARDRLARHLVFAGGALLGLQAVATLFASARLLLLPLPLLLAGLLASLPSPPTRRLIACVVAGNLALGLAISVGDMAYAGAYREAAPEIASRASRTGPGVFVGEWGLRAYLEAQGLGYLTTHEATLPVGARVVIPGLNCPWPLDARLQARLGDPEPFPIPGRSWLRTMDPSLGAGFYSDGYGPLPFALSEADRPYDRLLIYPVVR